jgi:hypothetical protein
MLRLGLRLTLDAGREAVVRLVITASAVALGVGLLLATLASINALRAQSDRAAWLGTGSVLAASAGTASSSPTDSSSAASSAAAADPLWWLLRIDRFGTQVIYRVDVAATGPGSPVPPGLARLPGPGQYDVSPALAALLRSTPPAELGDRFPGRQAGTIGSQALPSPDSLIVVIGHRAAQLAQVPAAQQVTSIQAQPGSGGGAGLGTAMLEAILAVAAGALLFPVLVFIGTATRLAAARREQRFAAMRLVGATPRQVSVIAAVEAAVAAAAGVAVGFGLFFLARPALMHVSLTGDPFAPGDLTLGLADIALVAVGVPAAAAAAARISLRRVRVSPLGVARQATPPAPGAVRLIPLLAGLAWLVALVAVGHPRSATGQAVTYLLAFLLIMAGLVVAGPWLTMAGSRAIVRRTGRPAVLLAGRRLEDNPRGAFRAVSGLILALFVTCVAVGVITTSVDSQRPSSGTVTSDTLVDHFYAVTAGRAVTSVASVPDTLLARLRSIPGVRGLAVIHAGPRAQASASAASGSFRFTGPASCAQLARTPALGRCPTGTSVVSVDVELGVTKSPLADRIWPAAAVPAPRLASLPVQAVVVGTNGSAAAIERARTALEAASPYLGSPATIGQSDPAVGRAIGVLLHMTEVVIAASLVIGGCSLAVSVAGGLADRRRPFSLLRLIGVPLRVLRRVVTLETVVPLLVIAVLSAGTGFLAAGLFVRSELGLSLHPPGADFYVIVLAGLAASLGMIASTFPLLGRITGPEMARSE